MGWSAFAPKGPQVTVPVTTAFSTAVQAVGFGGEPANNNVLVSNATSQGCFLAYGPTAAIAQAAATAGNPVVWLAGNGTQTFGFAPGTFFSTIAPATTTTVYITPGDGM